MRRRRIWWLCGVFVVLVLAVSVSSVELAHANRQPRAVGAQQTAIAVQSESQSPMNPLASQLAFYPKISLKNPLTTWPVMPEKGQTYTVVAIGGSAAQGDGDAKAEGGYLTRAFRMVNATQDVHYNFINESKVGYGPIQYDQPPNASAPSHETRLATLLAADKPNMLVISFGMLDDIFKKTPTSQTNQALHDEIADALDEHAVVVIVTPPSTYASMTYYRAALNKDIVAEMDVVSAFHNPNIYVIPLAQQMDQYITSHHQISKCTRKTVGTQTRPGTI
ncbi:SGNH/GDSL hydrolase family protein [Alicyclobacillus acidoterrestris]|uniref:SGNH/GDSL hydrolase family protein n=1 Tax=Alicyclobacillus acidoterrestris (strain ATCC 49025 / DSM 3922 / CIP 106132 / NCIMB 13137 / GD3B) TaxID=1356854 RepID=A0A9E7CWY7_ALIAG|nr:SGNH/GDSL hydrolase family protein [Alicyclobacillus acidoterrestris]UNO50243.1 SGNH/GDSL hydrolase family protein [Alicyclobacillus acidoterrestris]